jgi:hypothetical protein
VIALLQRVAEARVEVEGRVVGRIGRGILLFVCAEPDDTDAIADKLVDKVLRMRIFADVAGKMNLDLATARRRPARRQPVHPRRRHRERQPAGLFPAPRRPSSADGSTSGCSPPRRRVTPTWRTASSAPT